MYIKAYTLFLEIGSFVSVKDINEQSDRPLCQKTIKENVSILILITGDSNEYNNQMIYSHKEDARIESYYQHPEILKT